MEETQDLLVEVARIKPDPNQPRKIFEEDKIRELARSIESVGLENPIVIDSNYTIVTGERRWRAHKLLGGEKIKCRIVTPKDDIERLARQISENIHTGSMTVWETAQAMNVLCAKIQARPIDFDRQADKHYGVEHVDREAPYPRWVVEAAGRFVGKSRNWVYEQLSYLLEEDFVQAYLQTEKARSSYIREINRYALPEHKRPLKKMVTTGKFKDRETVNQVIRRSKEQPDKAKELFAQDYSKATMPDNVVLIEKIAPKKELLPFKEANDGSDLITAQTDIVTHLNKAALILEKKDILPRHITKALNFDNIRVQGAIARYQHAIASLRSQQDATEGEVVEERLLN